MVGVEEKRDGRRDGLARLNVGSYPSEEVEYGVFVPVYSGDDCGVVLQCIAREEVLYGCCWRCLTTTARESLAGLL